MAEASVVKSRTSRRPIGVEFSLHGALAFERDMGLLADRIPWFQERAIRTLARRLPVEARRDIQAEYNIRAGRVRDHLRAYAVQGEGSARLAGVRLVGQWKRGIGMINFDARWKRNWKGATYKVYRGSRQTEEGAFIARMKSGNVHVVERIGPKDFKRTYLDRRGKGEGPVRQRTRIDQRLQVLYRSSVAQMLARGRRPERLLDYSRNLLRADVERQIASYLKTP